MPKKFSIFTQGLSKEQRKDFAIDLNKFVQEKKAQFEKEKQESQEECE